MKTKRSASTDEMSTPRFSTAESAFLTAAVADGIRIQPRFRPEPLLARTGRGFMASTGVTEIARAKRTRKISAHRK
jgi:hypothetical protein